MSAFAMFALKDPSLLAFDHRRRDPNDNFRSIYGISHIPSDSQMRAVLDPVDPAGLRPPFREIFRRLQRCKELKRFVFLDGHYLVSLDGTTYFSSTKIHCPSCWRSTIAAAASPIPINCWVPLWSIPTSRKSSRWRRADHPAGRPDQE